MPLKMRRTTRRSVEIRKVARSLADLRGSALPLLSPRLLNGIDGDILLLLGGRCSAVEYTAMLRPQFIVVFHDGEWKVRHDGRHFGPFPHGARSHTRRDRGRARRRRSWT